MTADIAAANTAKLAVKLTNGSAERMNFNCISMSGVNKNADSVFVVHAIFVPRAEFVLSYRTVIGCFPPVTPDQRPHPGRAEDGGHFVCCCALVSVRDSGTPEGGLMCGGRPVSVEGLYPNSADRYCCLACSSSATRHIHFPSWCSGVLYIQSMG